MDFGNTVALSRVFLKSLQPDMNNVFIVGIIIAKQRPRKFLDTKGNGYRGVWNFTLRDSPRDYINVTIWAKHEDIIHISSTFNIGKVVELINPRIAVRNVNDYGEQFKPMVTSPFSLALNEPTQIVEHAVVNRNYYCNLLNLPTKPIAGLIPLNQVQNNGRNLNNVYIDVLGVLRGCGTPRTINTATGETFQVLHVEIFDVTAFSLSISLWDSDNILRASTWTPRYTVLFFTDVKLEWSDFEKAFRAKCTNRTVVTENPPCRETEFLLNYAKDAPIETFDIVDKMLTTLPDANQIQEIMSVNQIQNRVDSILQGITVDKQFSALVYAYITNMDLDGINKSTFAKCTLCRQNVLNGLECDNSGCPAFMDKEKTNPQMVFDLKINISDHTGTLYFCHFRGNAVENTFGCTIQDFLPMKDEAKYELKWQYIMEICAVRIFVVVNRGKPLISIVSINKEDTSHLAQKVPVF